MIRVVERSNRTTITPTDFKDMKCFRKNKKSRFTADGLKLYKANERMHEYLRESVSLNNKTSNKKELALEENADSVDSFFEKVAVLCKKSKSFQDNIIVRLLRAMAVKQLSSNLSTRKEEKAQNFFRYLRTLSPQASVFASANCGLDGKAISDRWMKRLNQKDRGACTLTHQ